MFGKAGFRFCAISSRFGEVNFDTIPPTQSQAELGKSIAILFLQFGHFMPDCSAAIPIIQTVYGGKSWMFINQVTFTNYFSFIFAPGSHAAGLMLQNRQKLQYCNYEAAVASQFWHNIQFIYNNTIFKILNSCLQSHNNFRQRKYISMKCIFFLPSVIYTPVKGLTCGLLNIIKADAAAGWIDWGNFRIIVAATTWLYLNQKTLCSIKDNVLNEGIHYSLG